ncbi:MAG: penicillin-binding protein activator, partial [Syntrophaceae bacterium]|nr:penicillin-binding protein activator [Syntrophaceae bacterium]
MKSRILIILILVLYGFGFSQSASKREWTIFQKGVQEYKQGAYKSAEEHFSLVLEKLPNSQLLTAYRLMLAKTRYKLEDYAGSLANCEVFLNTFPNSSYVDDIYYLMGNNYYRLRRYEEAVGSWLRTAEKTRETVLSKKAAQLAENTMAYRFSRDDLIRLSKDARAGTVMKDMALFYLADRYYKAGDLSAARDILATISESGSNSVYAQKAVQLQEFIDLKKDNVIRIAALLPLSGANSDIGTSLYKGMQLAAETFNADHEVEIELVPFDYETRLTKAILRMKEIASNPSYMAVFGPVENDITAACAVFAEYEDITLLSPTASLDELTAITENLFLLAPTVKALARNLNRYAVDSLKLKRIVSLAPLDDYFTNFVASFNERHVEQGGTVLGEQWYYPGDVDFSKQFAILKRTGLKQTFRDSVAQVDTTFSMSAMDSLYRLYRSEQKKRLAETKTKVDSADISVTAFDGVLVPIYRDDLVLIAPQFAYSNLQAQILGNSDWYAPEDLKKNKNYINGIVFVTDGYLNEESWDFRQYRNAFRNR